MQPTNITRLLDAIENNRTPHAVLIAGPEGSNACAYGKLAAAACCTNSQNPEDLAGCPDYLELGPGGIGVDDIRNMQSALHMRSFSGMRAVAILQAHQMTEAAQNALLKTLEDPPEGVILLLCGKENGLLPTIRSRCMTLRLGLQLQEDIQADLIQKGIEPSLARLSAQLAQGAPLLAQEMATPPYQAFYHRSADILLQVLTERLPPFAQAAELIKNSPIPASQDEPCTQTEERRQAVRYCLQNWLAILQDALYQKLSLPAFLEGKHSREIAQRFTIQDVQGIIELMMAALIRVGAAHPQLTMDHLLTAINGFERNKLS